MRLRLPWPLAASLLVGSLALSLVSIRGMRLDNTPNVYLHPDLPSRVLQRELNLEFPEHSAAIALIEGEDLFEEGTLRALARVAQELERHPLAYFEALGLPRLRGTIRYPGTPFWELA